jgi:hypothetical protein
MIMTQDSLRFCFVPGVSASETCCCLEPSLWDDCLGDAKRDLCDGNTRGHILHLKLKYDIVNTRLERFDEFLCHHCAVFKVVAAVIETETPHGKSKKEQHFWY